MAVSHFDSLGVGVVVGCPEQEFQGSIGHDFSNFLHINDREENSSRIMTEGLDLADEIVYLTILPRVSEAWERKHLYRIRGLGVGSGGKGSDFIWGLNIPSKESLVHSLRHLGLLLSQAYSNMVFLSRARLPIPDSTECG